MTKTQSRTATRFAIVLATAIAVAGCGGVASDQVASTTTTAEVASTAPPAPVVLAISGNQVDFGDALTQDTMLWFWAPW